MLLFCGCSIKNRLEFLPKSFGTDRFGDLQMTSCHQGRIVSGARASRTIGEKDYFDCLFFSTSEDINFLLFFLDELWR